MIPARFSEFGLVLGLVGVSLNQIDFEHWVRILGGCAWLVSACFVIYGHVESRLAKRAIKRKPCKCAK